jgi:hypothetical protein
MRLQVVDLARNPAEAGVCHEHGSFSALVLLSENYLIHNPQAQNPQAEDGNYHSGR